jgi:hypothetical protein
MDHEALKQIVRVVVLELQAERQAELMGRLEKARAAKAKKQSLINPHGFVMTANVEAVLGSLRKVQPARLSDWRAEFLAASVSSPETARKMFLRTSGKLIAAKMVTKDDKGRYVVATS